MAQPVDVKEQKRRKAYLLAKELGLTDADRMELAQYILRRDVTTWKGLDEEQLERLLDAMSGFQLICHLLTS